MHVSVGIQAPVDQAGALRELIENLAVGALPVAKKLQQGARAVEVAIVDDAPGVDQRVRAEVPVAAGTVARARRSESSDQSAAHLVVAGPALFDGELRPFERLVEQGLRRLNAHRLGLEVAI